MHPLRKMRQGLPAGQHPHGRRAPRVRQILRRVYGVRLYCPADAVKTGLLNTREEELRLYRVRDISAQESLLDRLFGVGSILLHTTDATSPTLLIQHVKRADQVKELLSAQVEKARVKNRVRAMEVGDSGGDDAADDEFDTHDE